MISYEDAVKLLRKYVKDMQALKHCEGVADFAFDLAKKISARHSELDINPERVRVAGLLHDLAGKEDYSRHEERSLEILRDEGLADIAEIAIHGFLYFKRVKEMGYSVGGGDVENKIVVYSDVRFKDSLMSVDERLAFTERGLNGTEEDVDLMVKDMKDIVFKIEKELSKLVGEKLN